uniref:Uncharacterized protein n=1 Tax=Tanacetum cinerariifolium TaxID=118510 RepID=A0A699QNW5_TANCI|nr:hypothetical protein [Tanacetum cinerariifolium]
MYCRGWCARVPDQDGAARGAGGTAGAVLGAGRVVEVGARLEGAAIFHAGVAVGAGHYKYLVGGGVGVVGIGAAGLNLDEHALFTGLGAQNAVLGTVCRRGAVAVSGLLNSQNGLPKSFAAWLR